MIKPDMSIKYLASFLIIALLIALMAYNGYRFMRIYSQADEQAPIQPFVATSYQKVTFPSPDMIISWNLFGKTKTVQNITAPKTRLQLKLIGIISSSSEQQARAIITDQSKKQNHYKVGDQIKKNVELKAIQNDHVVIINNGREEVVPLDRLKNKQSIIRKSLSNEFN